MKEFGRNLLEEIRNRIKEGNRRADLQIDLNTSKDIIGNFLENNPAENGKADGFVTTLLGTQATLLMFELPPEVSTLHVTNQHGFDHEYARYSETHPAPDGVPLRTWTLGDVDAHMVKRATAEKLRYAPVTKSSEVDFKEKM
jgi:hypothetical protein